MADDVTQGTTLRDTLEAAFEEHVEAPESTIGAETPRASTVAEAQPAEAKAEAPPPAEAKPSRTEGRARDDKGRLLPGAAKKEPAAATTTAATTPAASAAPAPAAAAVPPAPLARPSSWKKELEPQWAALAPDVQKYILQREGEYAKGVSTYKAEWDNAKPIAEAMQPFMPHLQAAGMQPAQWISGLGHAHLALAKGTPEQKLSMFLKLANDYQVPVQNLFQKGQDGQVYYNPQVQAYQPPAQQAPAQLDVRSEVQKAIWQERAAQSLAEFEREAATKYPHYEQVKPDMALLLEAGKAPDYATAYSMAIRLSDELWQAEQQASAQATEAARQKAAAEAAANARRNAVSPRSATPASAKPNGSGKRSLREELEANTDEILGGARV